MKIKAIWFSRHEPTEQQVRELKDREVSELIRCDLGARNIDTEEQLNSVMRELKKLMSEHGATEVFGVFPTPLLYYIRVPEPDGFHASFFAAWNVQRSSEGGKPTFSHKAFLLVGEWGKAPWESPA